MTRIQMPHSEEELALLPRLTWVDVHREFEATGSLKDDLPGDIDWEAIPVRDLGTNFSFGKLVDAQIRQCPGRFKLDDGTSVGIGKLAQEDIYVGRLNGGGTHPQFTLNQAVAWARDAEPDLPLIALAPEFMDAGNVILLRDGQPVNGQCAALPPIRSFARLESMDGGYHSTLGVVWFQNAFGISANAMAQILKIDWAKKASCGEI